MSGDTEEQGGTELMKTDTIVVAGGGQQSTTSSPPTESLNGGEEEPEKARKPVVEFQSDPCDDEEELCRICRSPGEEERPLYYPCACSGSMKATHEECLLRWLYYRNTQRWLDDEQCEICKHAFAFHSVYAENTPSRLPLLELIPGIALKAARWMRFRTGLLIFISVCLLVIPLMTAWMWRFISVRISSDADELLISTGCTPGLLLMDWFCGISILSGFHCRLDYRLLSNLVVDIILERLQELWRQRGRAGRQLVVEVNDPLPDHVGVWVLIAMRVATEMISHVLIRQAMANFVVLPLVVAEEMLLSLGYSPVVNSAWDRYAWLGCLGVVVLWYRRERMKKWLSDLHNSIRDDKYLIGKRLHNLERTHEKSG